MHMTIMSVVLINFLNLKLFSSREKLTLTMKSTFKTPFGTQLNQSSGPNTNDQSYLNTLYRSAAIDSLNVDDDEWTPKSFVSTRTKRFQGFKQNRSKYMDVEDRLNHEKTAVLIPITFLSKGRSLSSLFDKHLLILAEQLSIKPWSLVAQVGKSNVIPKLQDINEKQGVGYGAPKKLAISLQKTKKQRINFKLSVPTSYDDEESGPSLVILKQQKTLKATKKKVEKLFGGSFIQNNDSIDDYVPRFTRAGVGANIKEEDTSSKWNVGIKIEDSAIKTEQDSEIKIKQEPLFEMNSEAEAFLSQLTSGFSLPQVPRISLFHAQKALQSVSPGPNQREQRYQAFLQLNAGVISDYYSQMCVRQSVMTPAEIEQELQLFADRATQSTDLLPKSIVFTSDNIKKESDSETNEGNDAESKENTTTRTVKDWIPSPLLCKRFGIKEQKQQQQQPKQPTRQQSQQDHHTKSSKQSSLSVPVANTNSIDLYDNPSLYDHHIPDCIYSNIFT